MRGEFIFSDGTRVANNVMVEGRSAFLDLALRGIDTVAVPAAGNFYIGLCQGVPAVDVPYTALTEPTVGVNGYARLPVSRNSIGWAVKGLDAGEPYLQTKPLVFSAIGAAFDKPITRLFLGKEPVSLLGNIWALSAPIPTLLAISLTTPLAQRTFVYRLYLR